MKFGVISDIHSNIDALKAVFEEFEKENIDKVICAGDVIGIGPFSKECVDYLIENKDKFQVIIKGNHEGYLLKGIPLRNHNKENERLLSHEERAMHMWNHDQLSEKEIEFIKTWNNRAEFSVENVRIMVEHFPMKEDGSFKDFCRIPTYEQIRDLCIDKDTDVFIFGHTHEEIFYRDEKKLYINPGSLGCPVKDNGAHYGILEINDGNIDYKQCIKEYDVDKVIENIKSLKYPIHEAMIKIFYRR